MADFRKWVLVLAVLAMFVVPATAQVTCQVAASNVPVRAEGLAELVSQINLNCTNGGAVAPVTATFTAFFTTNVTSRLLPNSTTATEAVLTPVSGGVPVAPGTQGILTGPNSIVFNNIAIPAAGSFSLAINNVRVNANAIGAGGSVSVIMSATSSPANTVLFTGVPTATVAVVQTGLVFSAATSGSNAAPSSFQQCTPTTNTVNVTFKEGFSSSFKDVAQEGGVQGFGIVPTGTASQGTRLFVRFSGIPGNVTIAVPGTITATGTSTTATAILVGFDPAAGGTGAAVTAVPSSLTAITGTGLQAGLFAVPLTSGTGTAVYEVATDTNLTTQESFTVGVSIQTATGVAVTSSTTPPTVSGGFAPISTVVTSSSTAPTPRFADVANQNITLFSVTACVTNLLFPFLTNQAGFDTGVAIINTSLDNGGSGVPFNTTSQSGTCTVFYFGAVTGGGSVPAAQTTPSIAAGQMFAFALSTGGIAGSTSSTAGFQGYAIARCNFQFAHGYAFVSDLGAQKLAHGYLALVIPDRGGSRKAENFTTGGSGEQLAR